MWADLVRSPTSNGPASNSPLAEAEEATPRGDGLNRRLNVGSFDKVKSSTVRNFQSQALAGAFSLILGWACGNSAAQNGIDAACTPEERQTLLEICLEHDGDFDSSSSASGLTDCGFGGGGSPGGGQGSGSCLIQGEGECRIACNLPRGGATDSDPPDETAGTSQSTTSTGGDGVDSSTGSGGLGTGCADTQCETSDSTMDDTGGMSVGWSCDFEIDYCGIGWATDCGGIDIGLDGGNAFRLGDGDGLGAPCWAGTTWPDPICADGGHVLASMDLKALTPLPEGTSFYFGFLISGEGDPPEGYGWFVSDSEFSDFAVAAGVWYHFRFDLDAALGLVRLYRDDVLIIEESMLNAPGSDCIRTLLLSTNTAQVLFDNFVVTPFG